MAARTPPEAPGVKPVQKIRDMQRAHDRTVAHLNREHTYFEKTYGPEGEALDRLHPGSALAARKTDFDFERSAMPVQGARGGYGEARLPERRSVRPRSNFDWGGNDPGNVDGSRFEWDQRFDPPRRVGVVADSEGQLRSEILGEDHWPSGEQESILRDLNWLLETRDG